MLYQESRCCQAGEAWLPGRVRQRRASPGCCPPLPALETGESPWSPSRCCGDRTASVKGFYHVRLFSSPHHTVLLSLPQEQLQLLFLLQDPSAGKGQRLFSTKGDAEGSGRDEPGSDRRLQSLLWAAKEPGTPASLGHRELCKVSGKRQGVSRKAVLSTWGVFSLSPIAKGPSPGGFAFPQPDLQSTQDSNKSVNLDPSLAQPTLPSALSALTCVH